MTRFHRVRRARRVVGRVLIASVYIAGIIAAWSIHPLLLLFPVPFIVAAVAYRWVRVQTCGDRDPRDGELS